MQNPQLAKISGEIAGRVASEIKHSPVPLNNNAISSI